MVGCKGQGALKIGIGTMEAVPLQDFVDVMKQVVLGEAVTAVRSRVGDTGNFVFSAIALSHSEG